jgi:hypothetical protein
MGCGASIADKQVDSKEGPTTSPKHPHHGPAMSRSMRASSNDEDATFGNYVIDTSTLRFSTTEVTSPERTGPTKRFAKSDAVRELISSALKGNFIFESLTRHELENLIDVFSPISCVAGDEIIKQGAVGDFM